MGWNLASGEVPRGSAEGQGEVPRIRLSLHDFVNSPRARFFRHGLFVLGRTGRRRQVLCFEFSDFRRSHHIVNLRARSYSSVLGELFGIIH